MRFAALNSMFCIFHSSIDNKHEDVAALPSYRHQGLKFDC